MAVATAAVAQLEAVVEARRLPAKALSTGRRFRRIACRRHHTPLTPDRTKMAAVEVEALERHDATAPADRIVTANMKSASKTTPILRC